MEKVVTKIVRASWPGRGMRTQAHLTFADGSAAREFFQKGNDLEVVPIRLVDETTVAVECDGIGLIFLDNQGYNLWDEANRFDRQRA